MFSPNLTPMVITQFHEHRFWIVVVTSRQEDQ